jgi:large subunit ribosomal protein L10
MGFFPHTVERCQGFRFAGLWWFDEGQAKDVRGGPDILGNLVAHDAPLLGGIRHRKLETDVDRIEKREFVAELADVFAETSMVVVTRNAGMTVADVTALRRSMRAAGASFKVAKNRLALLALEGTRFDGIAPLLKGPTALSWSKDPVAVAKAAVDFAKTNDKFVLVGGALGTQMLDAAGVKALSELPSLDSLRAKILGLLNAPATKVAGVLQAPAGQLARVFAAYADSQKSEAA